MTVIAYRLLLIFSLAGLLSSGFSTYIHFHLVQDPSYLSFCDISNSINCTKVYLSRFGSFWNIPVALFGLIWFSAISLLLSLGGRRTLEIRENIPAYILVLSTVGLTAVFYLGYASLFILNTICLFCTVVYISVIGIFIVSARSTSFPISMLPRRAMDDFRRLLAVPTSIMTFVSFLGVSILVVSVFPKESSVVDVPVSEIQSLEEDTRSEFERWWESQPRVEMPVSVQGDEVVIVKFNDYQCPACSRTYWIYKPIFLKYGTSHPGLVRLVSMDYPLDPECNENAPNGVHDAACEAAVAVRLAARNGQDQRMEEWLFSNQETLSPEGVRSAAEDIAGIEDFDTEYERVLQQVRNDIAFGEQIPVTGTPTFLINGVVLEGGLAVRYFDAAIAYELERADSQ